MSENPSAHGLTARLTDLTASRRSFMGGVGAAAGSGVLAGRRGASSSVPDDARAAFFVYRAHGKYLVSNGVGRKPVFSVPADANAERVFQYAFDRVPEGGGTVVAAPNTFRFGAPATMSDRTALTGLQGTRLVCSRVGSRDSSIPGPDQENRWRSVTI